MRGIFVTFEGIEGCGKTTQAKKLTNYLRKRGFNVLETREAGGTEIGEKIREILHDTRNTKMDPMTEVFLFEAARRQHIIEIIKPSLDRGEIVICDRFMDATIAYQGYGRSLRKSILKKLNSLATDNIVPHITFLLDMEVNTGLKRAEKRRNTLNFPFIIDRYEAENLRFHESIRQGYLKIAKKEPERFIILDANQDIESIHSIIIEKLEKFISNNRI